MNAHQRKKNAKAFIAELKACCDDEKVASLLEAADDMRKRDKDIEQLRQRVAELEGELDDFESDIDTCTQHNVELQLEVTKLTAERDELNNIAENIGDLHHVTLDEWAAMKAERDALKQQRDEMTEHTPEPWSYGSFHRLLVVPIEDGHPNKHRIIADLGETEFPFNATLDSELRYNNARRIVACVNACAGISTETLESEGSAVMGWNRTASKLIRVTKQRDELLAALELCIPELRGWINAHGEDIGTIAAIKAGKAAITSVKEKQNAAD